MKTAIEALVSAEMRATRDAAADGTADPDAPRRSVEQMQADALVRLCEHALGCDRDRPPPPGATVVVRIDHDDLVNGTGYATIDGITAPVSVATARRMAAGGRDHLVRPRRHSEILDWGRTKRLFTRNQRLALVERDGGCAMCGAPPGHTKVHHIRWWARDAGPTDLANGVLLCESCHHRIHDNGWEIRIEGVGVTGEGVVHPATPRRPGTHAPPRWPRPLRLRRLNGGRCRARRLDRRTTSARARRNPPESRQVP